MFTLLSLKQLVRLVHTNYMFHYIFPLTHILFTFLLFLKRYLLPSLKIIHIIYWNDMWGSSHDFRMMMKVCYCVIFALLSTLQSWDNVFGDISSASLHSNSQSTLNNMTVILDDFIFTKEFYLFSAARHIIHKLWSNARWRELFKQQHRL